MSKLTISKEKLKILSKLNKDMDGSEKEKFTEDNIPKSLIEYWRDKV